MAEEHEAPAYKCAGRRSRSAPTCYCCSLWAKFDSQDQLQNHLKSCTQKELAVRATPEDWPLNPLVLGG